jgi:hypothetical protein
MEVSHIFKNRHYDSKGEYIGYSKRITTLLGRVYTEHFDAKGNKLGESSDKDNLFGNNGIFKTKKR